MLKSEARITIPSFVLYWILLGLLGWSVKIMDLLFVENWIIRSLAELPRIMLLSTISGLLGGFILGIGQQRVLRKLISKQLSDWWWKTLIGMALVAPGGMIIITTISWISFRIQG